MSYGVSVDVRGGYALFTRPELKVERMSYDVPTPSALVGMLESIYWHPGMRYLIDSIEVLNEIQFSSIRRNEVKSKASAKQMKSAIMGTAQPPHLITVDDIVQRASVVLRDVHYRVNAHFEMTSDASPEDTPAKFISILNRRIEKGQCYSQPYLGCREFPAEVSPATEPAGHGYYADVEERDLGLMLYGMDYSDPKDITPTFYHPVMRHGVITVPRPDGEGVYR